MKCLLSLALLLGLCSLCLAQKEGATQKDQHSPKEAAPQKEKLDVTAIFKKLDADGDGKLTLQEFEKLHAKAEKKPGEKKPLDKQPGEKKTGAEKPGVDKGAFKKEAAKIEGVKKEFIKKPMKELSKEEQAAALKQKLAFKQGEKKPVNKKEGKKPSAEKKVEKQPAEKAVKKPQGKDAGEKEPGVKKPAPEKAPAKEPK